MKHTNLQSDKKRSKQSMELNFYTQWP